MTVGSSGIENYESKKTKGKKSLKEMIEELKAQTAENTKDMKESIAFFGKRLQEQGSYPNNPQGAPGSPYDQTMYGTDYNPYAPPQEQVQSIGIPLGQDMAGLVPGAESAFVGGGQAAPAGMTSSAGGAPGSGPAMPPADQLLELIQRMIMGDNRSVDLPDGIVEMLGGRR